MFSSVLYSLAWFSLVRRRDIIEEGNEYEQDGKWGLVRSVRRLFGSFVGEWKEMRKEEGERDSIWETTQECSGEKGAQKKGLKLRSDYLGRP